MIVKDLLPSEPLRPYISQYRLRHFVFSEGVKPPVKPFPPRPEQSLTFYIRGSETSRHSPDGREIRKPASVLSGQFTYRVDRFVSYPEILMLIVDFKPGALHRLTGIPFTELTNREVDAEAIFPHQMVALNKRLSSVETYQEILMLVETFFVGLVKQHCKECLPVDQLLIRAMKDPQQSLDDLARHAFLSPRQLERKFDERIGVSPKTFLRIARFNQSYWLHLKHPKKTWFDIAMCCGYTDYQHLVKEYKLFAHSSPLQFFKEESQAPGRFLGLNK